MQYNDKKRRKNDNFNIDTLKEMLNNKFKTIDFMDAREDVIPFIEDKQSLQLWSEEFFKEITNELRS